MFDGVIIRQHKLNSMHFKQINSLLNYMLHFIFYSVKVDISMAMDK